MHCVQPSQFHQRVPMTKLHSAEMQDAGPLRAIDGAQIKRTASKGNVCNLYNHINSTLAERETLMQSYKERVLFIVGNKCNSLWRGGKRVERRGDGGEGGAGFGNGGNDFCFIV